ncbi:glucose/sorbosone dehydrogenase family protein [Desulfovibrio sp. X2]|uniref:PQQ-dependent sugar dehydrogenase n=1 Tax=Desulfovibrio sp. X2 TaxID=941449 RepID=UPI000358B900|nr:PQQ-dependent sugar dehydrogenase [Desulfovibrio sp. X2]EPR37487.1 glucose/sorbosone dehydrogenase family protein [Desulfovibrio sp. X2]
MLRHPLITGIALAVVLAGTLCLSAPAPAASWDWLARSKDAPDTEIMHSERQDFHVQVVAEGLQSPWGMAFLPDGRILVTERAGRIRVVEEGGLRPGALSGVPEVDARGEGGLLDIALHPDFARNHQLFLTYVAPTPKGSMTRVARYRLTDEGLADEKIIFPGAPDGNRHIHFGSRLLFLPDGTLLVTIGDRGQGRRAQDLMDLNGKTLRLSDDGGVPQDNPFVGRKDARPEIYTYGNRNSQGMAIHPVLGMVVQTEHGPSGFDGPGGGDEINIVKPGANYGWPLVHHTQTRPGTLAPVLEYTPAVAPSGACFSRGGLLPGWTNDFFFACLVGERLVRVRFSGQKVTEQEVLLKGVYGRLRDVASGPDGALYVLTSSTDAYGPGRKGGDRLLRLAPAP